MHKYFARKNYPMTTNCCRNGGIHGLIAGHAYTLLDVVQLQGGPLLAKIRNPWNKESYNGPWRDDDSRWTAAWKKQVNLQIANDGIFHMEYDTYISYFSDFDVAYYEDFASSNYFPISMGGK